MIGSGGAARALVVAAAGTGAVGWCGCTSTTDSLGANRVGPEPTTVEAVDERAAEAAGQLVDAYEQLFHGDPTTEAILFRADTGGSYLFDIFHNQIRTDGVGYGMLLAVLVDRQDDFDALWTYARQNLRYASSPRQWLLYWYCDLGECPDPNGMSYAITALIFADHRWSEGSFDYAADALAMREAMLHIEEQNGGIVDQVHDSFDPTTNLIAASPIGEVDLTIPGYMLPAFYSVWAKEGPDGSRWSAAATAAREALARIADPSTGLVPEQTTFAGDPVDERFAEESYRVGMNLAIDIAWTGGTPETQALVDRLVTFFAPTADQLPFTSYTLAGMPLTFWTSAALAAANAATATAASPSAARDTLLDALLAQPVPTGNLRYYDGLLYLLALASLSGAMVPY
jgi:oligosaccharide reducing-end xylanase